MAEKIVETEKMAITTVKIDPTEMEKFLNSIKLMMKWDTTDVELTLSKNGLRFTLLTRDKVAYIKGRYYEETELLHTYRGYFDLRELCNVFKDCGRKDEVCLEFFEDPIEPRTIEKIQVHCKMGGVLMNQDLPSVNVDYNVPKPPDFDWTRATTVCLLDKEIKNLKTIGNVIKSYGDLMWIITEPDRIWFMDKSQNVGVTIKAGRTLTIDGEPSKICIKHKYLRYDAVHLKVLSFTFLGDTMPLKVEMLSEKTTTTLLIAPNIFKEG